MKDLLAIREYEFYGVKVTVKINHRKKEASLVEFDDDHNAYIGKEWLFNERGLEYMNGWLNILSAMRAAVEEAKKELEIAEDAEAEKVAKSIFAIQKEDRR